MNIISTFLTILAWMSLPLVVIRVIVLIFVTHENYEWIRVAELVGADPIGDAVKRSAFVGLLCVAWLIARYNS